MKLLFERIAVPMAGAGTRGAWYRGLRVMAIDGLVLDCCPSSILQTRPSLKMPTFVAALVGPVTGSSSR
jgi:hypothetical protein